MSGKKLPNDKSQNTITGKHINQAYFDLTKRGTTILSYNF